MVIAGEALLGFELYFSTNLKGMRLEKVKTLATKATLEADMEVISSRRCQYN